MIIEGALSSLGAALLPSYLIEKELASGALVKLSNHELHTNKQYYMVTPADQSNEAVNQFCDWLKNNVS